MTLKPKFETGQTVLKWTGDYGGPGIVRGIAGLENGKLRYLVGHRIEGGTGEFLHVYAEGNLRDIEALDALDTVTKAQGLQSRTGLAEPNGNELLDALATAHRQVDMLMALVISLDNTFRPTQSSLWPDIVKRVELIQKHKTADEWLADPAYRGTTVLDPDGWDRKNFAASWNEHITRAEFERRLLNSTVIRQAPPELDS